MTGQNEHSRLERLLALHEVDQEILRVERERQRCTQELSELEESVATLEQRLARLDVELGQARQVARRGEQATEEKRDALNRLRGRVNQVQNEKQYSAASLEFDLVRQDLRKLEDMVIDKLQVVEDVEGRRKETESQLEEARAGIESRREAIAEEVKKFDEDLTVYDDRRRNLAIRLDPETRALYDRIRSGRSQVAVAPLTEEAVCGNCFTAVTVQQQMLIKGMSTLVCCEGCGVILYPDDLRR